MRERQETCEECRGQIDDLLATRSDLDGVAEFRRRVVDGAEDRVVPGAEARADLIREHLTGGVAEHDSTSRIGGAPRFYRPLAAAAAIVILFFGAWFGGLFDPSGEIVMGGGFELRAPVGEVESFDLFQWTFEDAVPGGYYRVVVWPEGGEEFETIEPIRTSQWRPEPETTSPWRRIDWQVIAYQPDGSEDRASPRATARLR